MANTELNLNDLLDVTLDDLADLPEFKNFPAGAHRVTVKFTAKKIGEHPAVEIKMTLLETVELNDPSDTPLEAGAEMSVAYMLDNEFGQGSFKKLMKVFADHTGLTKMNEVVEACDGMEVLAVTKLRPSKDKTKMYPDIVTVTVL